MARTEIVMFTDDIDGSEGANTVHFGIDGQAFEIDLSPANKAKLLAALAPFMEAGTKVRNNVRQIGSARSARARMAPKLDSETIRAKAAEMGVKVKAMGRVPNKVVAAYLSGEWSALVPKAPEPKAEEKPKAEPEPKPASRRRAPVSAEAKLFQAPITEAARANLVEQATAKATVKPAKKAATPRTRAPKGADRAAALMEKLEGQKTA